MPLRVIDLARLNSPNSLWRTDRYSRHFVSVQERKNTVREFPAVCNGFAEVELVFFRSKAERNSRVTETFNSGIGSTSWGEGIYAKGSSRHAGGKGCSGGIHHNAKTTTHRCW